MGGIKEIHLPEGRTLRIGADLSEKEQESLLSVLRKYLEAFASTLFDMPGIDPDILCYRLALDQNAKSVKQRKRKVNKEKREAIREETQKLIKVNHIREIQYLEWLANVVMVKKANGKWRMYVDFTNLYNVCPKDS